MMEEKGREDDLTKSLEARLKLLTQNTGMDILPHVGRANSNIKRLFWTSLLLAGTSKSTFSVIGELACSF